MPVPGLRRHEGKTLYTFGRATLFIDRNVVYIFMSDSQTYKAVSLDELLQHA